MAPAALRQGRRLHRPRRGPQGEEPGRRLPVRSPCGGAAARLPRLRGALRDCHGRHGGPADAVHGAPGPLGHGVGRGGAGHAPPTPDLPLPGLHRLPDPGGERRGRGHGARGGAAAPRRLDLVPVPRLRGDDVRALDIQTHAEDAAAVRRRRGPLARRAAAHGSAGVRGRLQGRGQVGGEPLLGEPAALLQGPDRRRQDPARRGARPRGGGQGRVRGLLPVDHQRVGDHQEDQVWGGPEGGRGRARRRVSLWP
mmetsp:Transcript_10943/g.32331  ORF Transcript_10943/g.32331 Transcript_10943/m.32331 type:complete len:253 (-) Transcript_10943:133-891(-)